jgi:hypothetical protein
MDTAAYPPHQLAPSVSKCTRAFITDKLDHSNTAVPFPLHFDDCELPGPLCHQPNLPRISSPRPARSAGAQQSVCAQLNVCAAADRRQTPACFPSCGDAALAEIVGPGESSCFASRSGPVRKG